VRRAVGAALVGAAALHAARVCGDVRRTAAAATVDLLGDGVRALGRRRPRSAPPRRQRRARHKQPQGIRQNHFKLKHAAQKKVSNI
jgi:hypothetical protein